MKIISWNVNGIRACLNKGFENFIYSNDPDIVCIQETKANKDQVEFDLIENLGYYTYWFSAQKKGPRTVLFQHNKRLDEVFHALERQNLYSCAGWFCCNIHGCP